MLSGAELRPQFPVSVLHTAHFARRFLALREQPLLCQGFGGYRVMGIWGCRVVGLWGHGVMGPMVRSSRRPFSDGIILYFVVWSVLQCTSVY